MKTKYYYNTVTLEYCGTDEPVGANFAFTTQAPPQKTSDSVILFVDGGWIVKDIDNEFDEASVSEKIDNLMRERMDAREEMSASLLVGDEEKAKIYAERMKEIDEEVKALKEE